MKKLSLIYAKSFNFVLAFDHLVFPASILILLTNNHHQLMLISITSILLYTTLFGGGYNYSTLFKSTFSLNLFLLVFLSQYFFSNFFFKNGIGFNLYFSNGVLNLNGVSFSFFTDFLSLNISLLTNLLTVILISYSYFYMKRDLNSVKFVQLIQFFSLSMLLFLCAGDVLFLFLGWELVGLSSFFLINFWSQKVSGLKSALKAFSFNKLSDFFFFLFLIMFLSSNNSNISLVFSGSSYYNFNNYCHISFLFLVVCGFFKSVQFGFHVWLPDSMEAPMPASALIHSATLISAGLYLTLRFSCYINMYLPNIYIISVFTAFYGSVCSFFQTDLKRVLAYSTISHCGYMYIPVFFDNNGVFIIYFYIHGFTKALCFLLVGLVIQDVSLYQDSRKTPNMFNQNSFEFFMFIPTLFSLGGIPFFFGFFSKYVLVSLIGSGFFYNFCYILFDLSSLSALFYCVNSLVSLFFNKAKKSSHKQPFLYQNFNSIYLIYFFLTFFGLLLVFYYIFLLNPSDNYLPSGLIRSCSWSFYIYKTILVCLFYKLSKEFYPNLYLLSILFVLL